MATLIFLNYCCQNYPLNGILAVCSFFAQYYAFFRHELLVTHSVSTICKHSFRYFILYGKGIYRHKPLGHFFFHLGISSLRSSKHSFVEFLCTNTHKIIKYDYMFSFMRHIFWKQLKVCEPQVFKQLYHFCH